MSGNGVSEKSDQQTSSVKIDDAPAKDLQHQSQTPASAQTQPSKGSEVSEASASAPAASAPSPAVTPSSKAATPVAKPATGGQQAKNAHNSVPQSHLNQAEQNHSDYNQYSGAYYQYNPNYNANYNGTYSNYKNHYNGGAGGGSGSGNHKQYSGNNRQGGGSGNSSRYNNNNSNNNNNNNSNNTNAAGNSNNAQGGPAHRKQYNNSNHHQKNMNHGNHNLAPGQQLPQGQYVNYNYGAAAAPQYYQFGGFYPPVYVQPLQYTAAAQSYATPGSGGATPQHQHQRTSSHSSSPKVTLTTKDGKPVDLEEKKRQTASSTPVASPLQKNASPVPSSTKVAVESSKSPVVKEASLSTPASNATTTTTTTTTATTSTATKSDADNASNTKTSANLSAAEEFKRRIRERAAANAAKKKQQEEQSSGQKTESGSKQEKPDEDAKKDTVEEPSHPAQEPAAKDQTAVAKETKEETKPETTIETTPEVKTSTEQKLESPKPVEKPEAAEPTVKPTEQKSEELNKTDEHTAEPAEKELQATTKPAESAESAEKPKEQTKEQKEENVDVNVNDNDNDNDDDEEDEDEEDETEAGEPVQELSITQFLERLNQATPIDNILAVEYPQNINGVDKTKQLPSKKYRYDPQFLIQFRDVVQYSIDADFKTRYEYLDVGAQQGMRRQGSAREGSLRGLGAGGMRQGSGLPSRYSGPQGKGGLPSAYDSSRQNSRSGSKRRGVSTRDKSIRKGPSTRRGGRGEMREKTEEELAKEQKPVEEVKPLEKSANRWIPKSRQQKTEVRYAEDGSVILEKEDVERKIKSLLNKLTLEMFTEITDEILDITKQSRWEKDASTIKQTISLTFAKACDEPYWSEMYAKFCAKMTQNILPEITDETSTLKDGSHPAGGALARRVLLSTCQVEYEKGWIDKLPTNEDGSPIEPEMMSDEYYAMAAAKRRGLGLVKFIGHLYNLNMLNDQIIYVCLRDQCSNTTDPSEDRIENLAQLIKTVGPKMDSNERTRGMLTGVFESIKQILEKAQLSSRIKFMLMDIQDLKAARWQSGKAEAQPTTIGAIHRDAEMSRLKQEQEKRKRGPGPSGGSSHYGGNKAAPSRSASNSDFFSNSGFKKSPSFARSNSSLRGGNSIDRVDRSDRSERNAHSPVSSGSDLQRDSSRRSENQQVNRFAALDNDDEEEEEEEEEQEEVHDNNNNNNNNNSEDKQEVGAEGKGKKEDI
ncbi:hypothetical protein PVL30_003425 [Lodderomyces elongisporus]|uniref:uncharacterized protein n=1 Tax=Lodderomyces elongisporus TaxID=36914 RepID=UPI002921FEA8|nr:uncharacterized protein PVL30_003425 [Lodderomyces elongisporus]WLF79668.1 hypothetical protein PVL30_003425 [Lodderomyces elongisporus]